MEAHRRCRCVGWGVTWFKLTLACVQTFLNFNNTATSNAQAIQQELPAIFSTSDARAVEGLTVTGTLFTALALASFIVSACAACVASARARHVGAGFGVGAEAHGGESRGRSVGSRPSESSVK